MAIEFNPPRTRSRMLSSDNRYGGSDALTLSWMLLQSDRGVC